MVYYSKLLEESIGELWVFSSQTTACQRWNQASCKTWFTSMMMTAAGAGGGGERDEVA
jgi:hypothetical protein